MGTTHARRVLFLAASTVTACGPPLGPIEEAPGVLGNGDFYYLCASWQDPSCAAVTSLDPAEDLPFPAAIAFGGRFGASYSGSGMTQAVSNDWLPYDDGYYTAARVGQPWIVALGSGVQDMLQLTVAPIASISIGPAKPPPPYDPPSSRPPHKGPETPGTLVALAATALDADGNLLAGDVLYSWASSNPSVVAIVGDFDAPSDSITVAYVAGGTAVLYAWTSTAQGSMTVTVAGGVSSEDSGAESGSAEEDSGTEGGPP